MTIRILHIWNKAGVGGFLSRYMDKEYDTKSLCITRKALDWFDLSSEKTKVLDNRVITYFIKVLLECRKYDILHFHAHDQYIKYFKMIYPNKKIIIHYHGTVIRYNWESRIKYWKHADVILVSTPDLLDGSPENTIWLPNVVDEDICFRQLKYPKVIGSAFHVDRFAIDYANLYADNNNLKLFIHDRDVLRIPHYAFINLLGRFEYYIDVKRDYPSAVEVTRVLKALSVTGLEALACGCKVINYEGKVINELPSKHESHNIVSSLYEIYNSLIENIDEVG